jgi:hypothetical protein
MTLLLSGGDSFHGSPMPNTGEQDRVLRPREQKMKTRRLPGYL